MNTRDGNKETGKEKLFNFRPVFFSALFLCLGIFFYFHHRFNGVSARWLLCLIPLAAAPFCFCRTRKKLFQTAIAVVALAVFFFIGFFSFSFQLDRYYGGERCEGEAYVSGRVVEKRAYDNYTQFVLDGLEIDGKGEDGKLVAYLPASFYEDIDYSDEIFLFGKIDFREVESEEFSLSASDFGDDLRFSVRAEEAIVTGHTFELFLFLRARAGNVIDAGMDETPASVTKAVLFGDTSGIDGELYENIRRGGIAHIFAVSGLHVGALFAFCLLLTRKTALRRLPKVFRFLLLATLLVIYAGICGFSSSVVRATVICLVAYASTLIGIKTDLIESLGLAAICILLFTPSALFEVGFQLSFAACFGIAFLSKPIGQVFDEIAKYARKRFPRKPTKAEIEAAKNDDTLPLGIGERVRRNVVSFLSASLGAQIFTAPLLLYYFGYVSGWALLLNCIFVPLISAAFSFLLLLVFLACLLPAACAFVILYLPNVVWSALLLAFQTVDFSSFAISGLKISFGAGIAYYAGCLFLSDKWNLKRAFSVLLSIACFLAFAIAMVALNI